MMINNVKCIIDAIVETCIYHKTTPKVRVDTEKLFIVSTGPSSKRFWEEPEFRTAFFEYEICILNDAFFRYKKEIFTLRPKYYCLFDSMYLDIDCKGTFSEENQQRRKILMEGLRILEKVNWPLTVVIPAGHTLRINNPNLSYVYINSVVNNDERFKIRFKFYKRNMMIPCRNNVVQGAIYFAIWSGCKTVGLIGAEYNFFRSVELKANGDVVVKIPHSFEEEKIFSEWVLNEEYEGRNGVVSSFLRRTSETLAGYNYLKEYADMENVIITNYSTGTMIEAFQLKE